MKRILLLPMLLGMMFQLIAQGLPSVANANASFTPVQFPGMCKSDKKHVDMMLNDPEYAAKRQQYHQMMTDYLKLPPSQRTMTGTVTIPVVVHVIYNPSIPETNISNAQIQSAIDNLNDAYSNDATLYGNSQDIQVQFALAVRDESCATTTGINRVDGTSVSGYSTDGITDANEVQVKALSKWDNGSYYNIWIVTEIDGNNAGGGTQGYAYFPGAGPDKDGAVILYNAFGYDPTGALGYELKSYTNYNVTTIHELGHGLDLYHTFQGDDANSDGNPDTCPGPGDDGDFCSDTDPHRRDDSDCDVIQATCNGVNNSTVHNNFMAYTSDDCQDRFTSDQKDRMRAALELERPSLIASLGATPISGSSPSAAVTCTPASTELSNSFGFGVYVLTLGSDSTGSGGTVSEQGYVSHWCNNYSLNENTLYDVHVTNGTLNNEDVAVYIDYNNDGDFDDANEEIFTSNGAKYHAGTFTTPSGFSGETVWVRVVSDWSGNTISGPCYAPQYGQVEDFSVVLNSGCTDPDVPVLSHSGTICDGSSASITITGDLNSATDWHIYTGSCGGTQIGTTQNGSYTVTPGSPSTTYFIRGEGGCVTPGSCGSITLNVTDIDDASFNYSASNYCQTDADPTPTITGDGGGTFTFSPSGLIINGGTGEIDLDASTAQTYTVTYTTAGACPANSDEVVQVGCVPNAYLRWKDRGKTMSSLSQNFYSTYVSGATQFEWQFTAQGTGQVTTVVMPGRRITLAEAGLLDLNETYDVVVRAYRGATVGNYAGSYELSSPAGVPNANLRSADRGKVLSSFSEMFYTTYVAGASQYDIELTPQGGGAPVVVTTNAGRSMTLNDAGLLSLGVTYDVRVRAYINGQQGNYSSIYTISSPVGVPNAYLRSEDRGKTLSSFDENFYSSYVAGASQYEFLFTPQGGGGAVSATSSNRAMTLDFAGLLSPNVTYDVQIRATVNGQTGNYANTFTITSPSSSAIAINDEERETLDQLKVGEFADNQSGVDEVEQIFTTSVYPNPFKQSVSVDFGGNNSEKTINIYNSVGQLLNSVTTSENLTILDLSELKYGIYMMQVVSGDQMQTIRLVKN